ncbi:hypothetical protein AB0L30_17800 [Microbispora rosea]|uniref:hypothetical protein n=1 Tax=Microbispora rosea TaxID=58117 RepID=UPI0034464DD0
MRYDPRTNEGWGPLIATAKEHRARIVAYRNARRPGRARVPEVGIHATVRRLRRPRPSDGFDAVHTVILDGRGGFAVRDEDDPSRRRP